MFTNMDIVQILQIAGAGLSFLLVIIAYNALMKHPDRFKLFASFAIVMMLLGITPTLISSYLDSNKYNPADNEKRIVKLQSLNNSLNEGKLKVENELNEIKSLWCNNVHVKCDKGMILNPETNTYLRMNSHEIKLCRMFACH